MISGNKVFLKSLDYESIEQLREWRNNEKLRNYFREYREINDFMQKKWFEQSSQDKNQVNFEIRDKESNKLIGHCGLYYIHWVFRTAEFGIYIGDNSFRNGGYGSDALRTLVNYGFFELNLHRIWCEVYENNKAVEIYKHIGFKKEGVLRKHYFCNGTYLDSTIMGILRSEWMNRNI